jgi:molybdenum ABC transporter molybdate-binding protein
MIGSAHAQTPVPVASPLLFAAGSLRYAMDDMIRAYRMEGGATFQARYGPSEKLKQEIEAGAKVDVFASASIDHTDALAKKKLLGPSQVFTHNDLCVVAKPGLNLQPDNLLDILSKQSVRLATSTPISDPMGDYTWQFFRNADRARFGLYQEFDGKALQLSGAAIPTPGEQLPYVSAFEDDKADAYIMYCTNAVATWQALPQLAVIRIPAEYNVVGNYGISASNDSVEGRKFVAFVLSAKGQQILKKYGFN